MDVTDTDHRWMRTALALGRRGAGRSWPNPAVGCVIVARGVPVGRGWTQPGGRPHAEAMALTQAGAAARGATAYVTLEPCAHQGRAGPCTDALIAAGVGRVVAALRDPDPRTDGQGFARLARAGIAVTEGVGAAAAARDLAGFLLRVRHGRPALTLKLATSFDGRIATATGESRWITGPEARRAVHAMRARHDAVLVGGGTARADDPSLTVRGLGTPWQPVRIVATRRLDLPLDGVLARTARAAPVWLVHGPDADPTLRAAWEGLGARPIEAPVRHGQLDPAGLLAALGKQGLTHVFCEGGGALAASFLAADMVDDLVGFTAGLAIGAEGQPGIGALGVDALAEAPRFALDGTSAVGPDIVTHWRRVRA
ncbi:MAG: bifunctional diaminohydroxyphosphoribosylaminopyrimidine deaminase/5-amino-6-(5-phosphoribosylamino)uracil reductase RibD [Shimia sp.]